MAYGNLNEQESMYQSVEAALSHAYRLSCMRIEPLNNTAQICHWMESKGAGLGGYRGMTQHDWHANSAMIRARVERLLNHLEVCAVEAQYGGNLSRIVDLSSHILNQQQGIPLLVCDALLSHIFSGSPKQTEIQDRFDLSKGKLYRQLKRVNQVVNALLNSAICKLEPDFKQAGIVK